MMIQEKKASLKTKNVELMHNPKPYMQDITGRQRIYFKSPVLGVHEELDLGLLEGALPHMGRQPIKCSITS